MRVTFAQIATDRPMGQQAYESAIQAAVRLAAPPDWDFRTVTVTSLRNPVSADRRVPWGLLNRLPAGLVAATAGYAYGRRGLVHRLDLRLPPAATAEVVTAHDLPGLRFPDEGTVPAFLAAGAQRARLVIVPSTFAGNELVDLLNLEQERIRVIPYGLDQRYASSPSAPMRSDLQTIPTPFILHAAGATLRKNLAGLAAAWPGVLAQQPESHLVLCGPKDQRRDALFEDLPQTHLMGALDPSDVSWLMHRAAAVVVPSVYEGFGLPALEGMAAGTPVVAAQAGALPEVCGDAAELVLPTGDGLAAGLLKVLEDHAHAQRLRERGLARAATFSWEAAAVAHLDVYRSCGQD